MALKAYKYRIYPDAQQRILIEKTFGCVQKVYNLYVSWNEEQYRKFKDTGEKYGKKPEVSAFKRQFGFLKEVDTNALSYAKMNFEKASRRPRTLGQRLIRPYKKRMMPPQKRNRP